MRTQSVRRDALPNNALTRVFRRFCYTGPVTLSDIVHAIPNLPPWIIGQGDSSYVIARWMFLRALGVVYLIAFLSLLVQVKGLLGTNGILPAQDFLDAVKAHLGVQRFHLVPTVFWFTGASDMALQIVCWLGIVGSFALILGIAPMPTLVILWILYLSLFSVGRDFLSFQWDILLLEAGFLAIFLAPVSLLAFKASGGVSALAMLLLWWLLFRFMVESGMVKLVSGDSSWRDLTALNYHYFTQPLPTWTAWYMHQLPQSFQKLSVLVMYVLEIGFPFLLFFPRPLRIISALGMTLLMILITATGNYTFFTLLTVALCLLLIDDVAWTAMLPERIVHWLTESGGVVPIPALLSGTLAVVAVVYLLVSVSQLLQTFNRNFLAPAPVRALESLIEPLRISNSYGLFRVMTRKRPEIIIEGSDDGREWRAYAFRWKPGDVSRAPAFVEPHQPRLDWQMWFAALGSPRTEGWFPSLLGRLLQGSPDVLALLTSNPFPDRPPTYVRALLYDYRFTSPEERRRTGAWWVRTLTGTYAAPVSLSLQ
jgi:lipase maturation factor 1